MVQIGNFHIGGGETAIPPALDAGEAFFLWDTLVSHYDIIMQTQIFQNFIHDPDFKLLLARGLTKHLEKQVDLLEKEMNKYKLVLPIRPPKSVSLAANSAVLTDEHIFRAIFSGVQSFTLSLVKAYCSFITTDPMRGIFGGFLKEEIEIFDDLCKYGKLKGWLQQPPLLTM